MRGNNANKAHISGILKSLSQAASFILKETYIYKGSTVYLWPCPCKTVKGIVEDFALCWIKFYISSELF